LTYCPNGDLLQYITDAGHLEIDVVRFYSAELIEALEQLHIRNIIHRDLKVIKENVFSYSEDLIFLKPENILLTDDMHIQLTDFGSSFIVENNEISPAEDNTSTNGEKKPLQRMNSFVGTAQFVAPEILQRGPVNYGFVRISFS
jgi:3-phosphoinositide dependent protein kinase-1